jgi:two-component system, OmpR family, sensor histidine kinase ChvG
MMSEISINRSFSSLTRRIVSLNVAGLLALAVGIISLSQLRAGLIDARIQSLAVQGQVIASAVASATVDSDSSITIDPARVAPVLHQLISSTRTRARIYDRDGVLLVDSRDLYSRGELLRFDLPANAEKIGVIGRAVAEVLTWLGRGDLPLYRELAAGGGKGYEEVTQALNGQDGSKVRITDRGDIIVSVAVAVQRFHAVRGAVLLSTRGADIDNIVMVERLAILKVFLITAAVMVMLSILLAGTIAEPLRRLKAP